MEKKKKGKKFRTKSVYIQHVFFSLPLQDHTTTLKLCSVTHHGEI